jgi:hypothetical protein
MEIFQNLKKKNLKSETLLSPKNFGDGILNLSWFLSTVVLVESDRILNSSWLKQKKKI